MSKKHYVRRRVRKPAVIKSPESLIEKVAHKAYWAVKKWITTEFDPKHEFIRKNMCGACAHASYVVKEVLVRLGHDAEMAVGNFNRNWRNGHFWVRVNGTIVDATVEQFNVGKRVNILTVTEAHARNQYYLRGAGAEAESIYTDWAECGNKEGRSPQAARDLAAIIESIVTSIH